jgi:hypothetical protein
MYLMGFFYWYLVLLAFMSLVFELILWINGTHTLLNSFSASMAKAAFSVCTKIWS